MRAAKFFPAFAPGVVNWKHKLSGKNGKGKPYDFSEADRDLIEAGVKQCFLSAITNMSSEIRQVKKKLETATGADKLLLKQQLFDLQSKYNNL